PCCPVFSSPLLFSITRPPLTSTLFPYTTLFRSEFFKRFYAAHFTAGEVLRDADTIVRISEEIGLTGEEVRGVVENEKNTDKIEQDIGQSQQLSVQGVPFFLVNDKYSISVAQPVEHFHHALHQVWEEEQNA